MKPVGMDTSRCDDGEQRQYDFDTNVDSTFVPFALDMLTQTHRGNISVGKGHFIAADTACRSNIVHEASRR